MTARDRRPLDVRFWAKVDKSGDCWLWTGAKNSNDYGQITVGGRRTYAHHYTFGVVPLGLELDHLCRTPACVNPAHLEAVTHQENMARGSLASRTHCNHGHLFDEANTYIRPDGDRECRTCHRERVHARVFRDKRCPNVFCSVHGDPRDTSIDVVRELAVKS